MISNGPIVLIEDDNDDALTMQEALKDLNIGNEFIYFPNTILALKYLKETKQQPFLIICDVNMPFQNGLDFAGCACLFLVQLNAFAVIFKISASTL